MAAALAFVVGSETASETRETVSLVGQIVFTVGSAEQSAPIEHTGKSVIFDPSVMVCGQPYPFKLEGIILIAVKHEDGNLDFYSLP